LLHTKKKTTDPGGDCNKPSISSGLSLFDGVKVLKVLRSSTQRGCRNFLDMEGICLRSIEFGRKSHDGRYIREPVEVDEGCGRTKEDEVKVQRPVS
jgi:hypothetical protein